MNVFFKTVIFIFFLIKCLNVHLKRYNLSTTAEKSRCLYFIGKQLVTQSLANIFQMLHILTTKKFIIILQLVLTSLILPFLNPKGLIPV